MIGYNYGVGHNGALWIWDDDQLSVIVRLCTEEACNECGNKLEAKLDIGKNCLPEEKKALVRDKTICDQIWEKPASTHTTARHTFHHQTIAVHVD